MGSVDGFTNEIADINTFEYVVQFTKPGRVCFGSGQEKNLFSNELQVSTGPELGPGKYDITHKSNMKRILCTDMNKGSIGGFTFNSVRFQEVKDETPSPNYYNIPNKWKKSKLSVVPFNQSSKIRQSLTNAVPGVGTYELAKKTCRRLDKQYNFGKPTIIHSVEILCRPFGYDKCSECMHVMKNDIDYWHRNYTNYLCNPCLAHEKIVHRMYSAVELKQFKKVRNCRFFHKHVGTSAVLNILPKKTIRKIQNMEDYLSLYQHIGNEKRDGPTTTKITCVWRRQPG